MWIIKERKAKSKSKMHSTFIWSVMPASKGVTTMSSLSSGSPVKLEADPGARGDFTTSLSALFRTSRRGMLGKPLSGLEILLHMPVRKGRFLSSLCLISIFVVLRRKQL